MTSKTKYRIAGGILAFALGMLGAQVALGDEYPQPGDDYEIHAACATQATVEKLLALRNHPTPVSEEENQLWNSECQAVPEGYVVTGHLIKMTKSGVFMVGSGDQWTAAYAEVWGVDFDGDGTADAFTLLLFKTPRPTV